MSFDKLDWRQKVHAEGRALCCRALGQLVSSAKDAGVANITAYNLEPEDSLMNPAADVDGVHIECVWGRKTLSKAPSARLVVGSYTERRAYPVKVDGTCNTKAIFARVKEILYTRKEQARAQKASEQRQKEDEEREKRLAPLHRGLGAVRVECEYGLTKVIASGLGEQEAKRVLAALAEVLRPAPAVGEIWQHKKVQMPSRIISMKDMVKLEGVENKQVCAIPRPEFVHDWELVSAAEETAP